MRSIAIINSERMQAIGDCVSAFPAVRALAGQEPVAVYFSSEATRPLFAHPEVSLLDSLEDCDEIFDVQVVARLGEARGLHLAHAWFMALGLSPIPDGPLDFGIDSFIHSNCFTDLLIAPFSASDAGGAKTWPEYRWADLAARPQFRRRRIGLVCGAGEATPVWCSDRTVFLRGLPLQWVCSALAYAHCVITIDNGISWLAQAVRVPHVLLQSSNHAPFWTPDLNPGAVNLPDVRNVTVDQVLAAIEKVTRA